MGSTGGQTQEGRRARRRRDAALQEVGGERFDIDNRSRAVLYHTRTYGMRSSMAREIIPASREV